MSEIFPYSWCRPEYQELVEDFIRNLPVSADIKKQVLIEWCDCAGVRITAEKVERVTGLPAGEV
jgi:hypothetical protein